MNECSLHCKRFLVICNGVRYCARCSQVKKMKEKVCGFVDNDRECLHREKADRHYHDESMHPGGGTMACHTFVPKPYRCTAHGQCNGGLVGCRINGEYQIPGCDA